MTTEEMRSVACSLFDLAVEAADPALAIRSYAKANPLPRPGEGGKTLVIALGKAAPAMIRETLVHVTGPVVAFGVTHHGNAQNDTGAELVTAGHPVPDQAGLDAGKRILEILSGATADDQVIALISGGGSSLTPAPAGDLTLEDKAAVNQLLLESGLEITSMNLIRQQLSELKGGGFLRHAAPAPVHALILSDVIGDDLRAIASGPTVAPLGTAAEARSLMESAGIWERAPLRVREHLLSARQPLVETSATNVLIGSNGKSLEAMLQAAGAWDAKIVSRNLTGDVADAARLVLKTSRSVGTDRPTALIFGGETTVQIRGTGRGGRNQELAMRVAKDAGPDLAGDWVFLSGGTDGRDGPTDAAGGIVDAGTTGRIRAAGVDVDALLANNDSYALLDAAGDLLMTGPTGTNVADVQVMLLRP